jgi:hypothetical protein
MKESRLFLFLLSAILLSACGGDNSPSSEPSKPTQTTTPTTTTPTIEIATTENTSPVLSQTSGSAQLSFKASGDWTATCSESWIKVSQASGKAGTFTITISASNNDTYDDRKGTVTISIGSVSKAINVSQVQKDAIVLALQDYELDPTSDKLDFEVETNVSLAVAISEDASSWITQATTRALHTESLHFDIAPNMTLEAREGTITISGGSATQTIKVKQDGDGVITFEDAVVKGICINKWDTDADGKVSYSEVAAVEDIGTAFMSSNIKTFNELRLFKGLKSISGYAFAGCTSLASITLPDGVTFIGKSAFADCSSLTNITLPHRIESIENGAFYGCRSLTSITLPDGLKAIGRKILDKDSLKNGVFGGCISLTSITLPDGVITIEYGMFNGCTSLTSVTLPEGLTTIGGAAFYGCTSLASITLPIGVKNIGEGAFASCTSLASITLPDGVITIEGGMFYGCTSLTSVTLPDGISYIGGEAFASCTSLASITLPDGLTVIDFFAFYNCTSLTSITLPDGVTGIGDEIFLDCSSLTSITCLATTPPSLNKYLLGITNDCPIYVPAASLIVYKAADGWKDLADRIQAIPE